VTVPRWIKEKCIQCNQCSLVCPHATIRPVLHKAEVLKDKPEGFDTVQAKGKGLEEYQFRVQVSPLDCTGCGSCANVCPAPGKALEMAPISEMVKAEKENWDYAYALPPTDAEFNEATIKGSQFKRPLFEFSGACAGCGETPYIKLATQLFGDRMIIANATGCSSIYGGHAPTCPYSKNEEGHGPAWANSLFEDNAEYGFGMRLAYSQRRQKLYEDIKNAMDGVSEQTAQAFSEWLETFDDNEKNIAASKKVKAALKQEKSALAEGILKEADCLAPKSVWIIGGDGWAYDIGYGGLDHVLAMNENVNILVLDTELYSNTGGQASKSTPTASVVKFAAAGKRTKKKDLGMMAMSYGYVYVAQISLGANMNQAIRAMKEAEAYDGPSLIIAYSPCINHGIDMGRSIESMKKAVETGYWALYRYNPQLAEEGKNPFSLDSKDPIAEYQSFLDGEIRYKSLKKAFPDLAEELFAQSAKEAKARLEGYKRLAEGK